MHRALIIRLGDAFEEEFERIAREGAARQRTGVASTYFLSAPVRGVGNLSNPVQVLRENLQKELEGALVQLLTHQPGGGSDVVLDVFLLLNFGEPLVANAATVVIEFVVRLLHKQFGTMFPEHRTGPARRVRLIPIGVLPSSHDCAKDLVEAVLELSALHDVLVEQKKQESDREFPLDRFFLLDGVTAQGLVGLDDLVDQVGNFLRLVLFSGLRREVAFVALLEGERNDLFASFGCASCSVDFELIRDTLSQRLARDVCARLTQACAPPLPSPDELLPLSLMEADDEEIEDATAALAEVALRALETDGACALEAVIGLFDELAARTTAMVERAALESSSPAAQEAQPPDPKPSRVLPVLFVALPLGGAIFSIAFFAFALTVALSIAVGSAFALLGALLTLAALGKQDHRELTTERRAATPDVEAILARARALSAAVDGQRTRLVSLREQLEAMAAAQALNEEPGGPVGAAFRTPMVDEALLELLAQRSHGGAASETARFVEHTGGWSALHAGNARFDATRLDAFCRSLFDELGGKPLLESGDCRDCAAGTVADFIEHWKSGIAAFLEGESRQQFDPDGFRRDFQSELFTPPELAAVTSEKLRATSSKCTLHAEPTALDDVFLLTVLSDIHPDAIAAFQE